MRVALYVRVSTSHQVQLQTIEQQLTRLRAYVDAQGWTLSDDHIFRDDGYSGAILARPGLDCLRDRARNREFDYLLLTTPDRLARNYVHQMVLIEEFAQVGCQVTFLDRPMSDDPHDHLLLQIRGAVAEYERTLIAERMRRGRLTKLQAGLMLPWTYPPYGYRLHPDRPRDPSGVTLDPLEAAIVAELFASYLDVDMSIAKLAKTLQQRGIPTRRGQQRWSGPTIRGILRNPTYTGQVYAQRTHYRPAHIRRSATHPIGRAHGSATPEPPEKWIAVGTVPAIISQEQFDQVQAKLAQNQSFASRNNTAHQYLLRALVSCGTCQLACTARTTSHGRYHYYLCNGKLQAVHSHRDEPCPARFIPAEQLDQLVWRDVCDVLTHPEQLAAELARVQGGAWLPQELQARRENLHKARLSLQQQCERLTDAYLRAVIPLDEYERRRHDLEQKEQALAEQEALLTCEAERQIALTALVSSIDAFCQRVQDGLTTATFEQKRQLVLLLIDRVIVTDGKVEIRYVIPTTSASEHVRFCHLRKDYFNHPTPLQQHEAFLLFPTQDWLKQEPTMLAHPGQQLAAIAAIDPDPPQFLAATAHLGKQLARAFGVGDRSGGYDHHQHQAQRIDQ
jgi:site-specific DNA recombinase